jgi:pyruvate dehydrogenase E1 component alpha subunit
MAKIWDLPIVFVCENNLYMEYTAISDVTAVEHPAADRASAYSLEKIIVDGNDADEMFRTAQTAIQKAREGNGPSLIEAKTYRHSGHSRADPGKYRPDEEVKDWLENKDPITNYRKRLLDYNIDEKVISDIENKIKQEVEEATEISKSSPIPDTKEIFTDVWADGGYEWHN